MCNSDVAMYDKQRRQSTAMNLLNIRQVGTAMSTTSRLILILTLTVGAVITATRFYTLRQREAALETAMRGEVRAHALTLQIALEQLYADNQIPDAQRLIDRLSQNSNIYGVVLFDDHGQVVAVSNTLIAEAIREPPELAAVLATGEKAEFIRPIHGEDYFSIILPIYVGSGWHGACEITQPMSFVRGDIAQVRRSYIITTLLVFVTIFLVVFVVLRRSLSAPIEELLGGAAALGRGDFAYRVIVPRGGNEFGQLAREFNRMADQLDEQRRKAAYEADQRLELEREVRHHERLASVGRLAAGVAHELGAPLNVIDARAEQLLAKSDAPPPTRQRNLTIIRAQVEKMTRIVRQLLTLARPYHLHRKPVELAPLITGVIEQIEVNAARAAIEIHFSPPHSPLPLVIDADADFMRQALLNICTNALQAMSAGGRLQIECLPNPWDEDGQAYVQVLIADSGDGIAADHLPHIFDPFYTTKDVGSGTGLGLAVTHRIVEEHGGWIEAANRETGGAVFTLYLPMCETGSQVTPTSEPEVISR